MSPISTRLKSIWACIVWSQLELDSNLKWQLCRDSIHSMTSVVRWHGCFWCAWTCRGWYCDQKAQCRGSVLRSEDFVACYLHWSWRSSTGWGSPVDTNCKALDNMEVFGIETSQCRTSCSVIHSELVLAMVPNWWFGSGSRLEPNWIRCTGFCPIQKLNYTEPVVFWPVLIFPYSQLWLPLCIWVAIVSQLKYIIGAKALSSRSWGSAAL